MNQDPNTTDASFSFEETPQERKARIKSHPDNYWTLRNVLILVTTTVSSVGLALSLSSFILAYKASATSSATQRELRDQDFNRQVNLRDEDFERQRLLKETDLRQYCQRRYDDLAYETGARVKSKSDARSYYKRFWDLQFEQYQYCKDGLIAQKIFATWMASRRLEYDENEPVGKLRYQKGWAYMSDWFTKHDYGNQGDYTEFVDFMNDVFQGKKATCDPKPSRP